MAEYPIILIPQAIQEAKLTQPPIPKPPSLPIPVHPGDMPKRVNTTMVVAEALVAVILSSVIDTFLGGNLGTMLLIGGLGAITAQTRQQWLTFGRRKQKHQQKIAIYRQEKKERERQEISYYKQVQARFRDNSVLKVLSRTKPHDGNKGNAHQGASEAKFHDYLSKYFLDNIHTKLTVSISDFQHPYSPDFSYIDSETNLYIDIEIDEPYSYREPELEPIHYMGVDAKRNQFFLERGWLIIRFREEQIVKYPDSCCKTIAETIDDLLDDDRFSDQFIGIPSLRKMKQWTFSEAEKMAQTDYRKTYSYRTQARR